MLTVSLRRSLVLLSFVAIAFVAAGCKKTVATAPPAQAPAPTAARPTVSINASPGTIAPGGTVTLSWTSTDATDLDIEPGVGKVVATGTTPVNPTESTTYTITATGPGGNATASTSVIRTSWIEAVMKGVESYGTVHLTPRGRLVASEAIADFTASPTASALAPGERKTARPPAALPLNFAA